jgi:hypothetical protein
MNWDQIKLCNDINEIKTYGKIIADKLGYKKSEMSDKIDTNDDINALKFIIQRLNKLYLARYQEAYKRELSRRQYLIKNRKHKLQTQIDQLNMFKESCSVVVDKLKKDTVIEIPLENCEEQLIDYIFPDEQTKYRALYAAWMDSVINIKTSYNYFKTFFAKLIQNKSLLKDFPQTNLKIYMRSKETNMITIKFNNGFVGTINYNNLVKHTDYNNCNMSLLQTIPVTQKVWSSFCLLMAFGNTFKLCDNIFQMNTDDELVFWRLFVMFGCDDNETEDGLSLIETNEFRKYVNEYYTQFTLEITSDQLENISNLHPDDFGFDKILTDLRTITKELNQQDKSIIESYGFEIPEININDTELSSPYDILEQQLSKLINTLAQYMGTDFTDPYNKEFVKFYELTSNIRKPYVALYQTAEEATEEAAKQQTKCTTMFNDITKQMTVMINSSHVDQNGRDLIIACFTNLIATITQILDQSMGELNTLAEQLANIPVIPTESNTDITPTNVPVPNMADVSDM